MSTTEAGKSWSADLTKHSGGEALHPLWVAEVEGRITTIEREAAEKERERLRAILNDHQPYQERSAMECDNGLCGHEPYLDHVLALLAEEGKGRLW